MFYCDQHQYKQCTFFDTKAQTLQCTNCILPSDYYAQNNDVVIDIEQVIYIAHSLLNAPKPQMKSFNLKSYQIQLEELIRGSMDQSVDQIQQAYQKLNEAVNQQLEGLNQKITNLATENNQEGQIWNQMQQLLDNLQTEINQEQYIQVVNELNEAIFKATKLENSNEKGFIRLQQLQEQLLSQVNEKLKNFNSLINEICRVENKLNFDQEVNKHYEIENFKRQDFEKQAQRSVVLSKRSLLSTQSKFYKKETLEQIVKKELKCSLTTNTQLSSVLSLMNLLIAGTCDGQLIVYDNESWEELQRFTQHKDMVKVICQEEVQQTYIASGSLDKTIKIYKRLFNEETAQFSLGDICTLIGHHGGILAMIMQDNNQSKYPNILISSSTDNTVRIWNYLNGEALMNYTGHQSDVHALSYSQEFDIICSGSNDKSIRLWDSKNFNVCRPLNKLLGHQDSVMGIVVLSEDQKSIASCSFDKTIRIWDIIKAVQLKEIKTLNLMNKILQYQPGLVVIIGFDDYVQIWDYSIKTSIHKMKGLSKVADVKVDSGNIYTVENTNINIYY